MRPIDTIIVHCSDSDHAVHDNVQTIREWHVSRGFSDIGYHFVITKDGFTHEGRPIEKVGAHCKGFNQNSIGVCLTGSSEFTIDQLVSLGVLIERLRNRYGTKVRVRPHKMFNHDKTCPNFDLRIFHE